MSRYTVTVQLVMAHVRRPGIATPIRAGTSWSRAVSSWAVCSSCAAWWRSTWPRGTTRRTVPARWTDWWWSARPCPGRGATAWGSCSDSTCLRWGTPCRRDRCRTATRTRPPARTSGSWWPSAIASAARWTARSPCRTRTAPAWAPPRPASTRHRSAINQSIRVS